MYDQTWNANRGFWTKRRRSATSLVSILALVAGIAVAYKLFDQTVPNNVARDAAVFDYEITKSENGEAAVVAGPGNPIFANPGLSGAANQYPGDTRTVDVTIDNNNDPLRDASFQVHVEQTSIVVTGCVDAAMNPVSVEADGTCSTGATSANPVSIDPDGPAGDTYTTFAGWWTLDIDKEAVYTVFGGDFAKFGMTDACEGSLTTLTDIAPCPLGLIREDGATSDTGDDMDVRAYEFNLTEADTQTDQSGYKGWTVEFDLVFNAKVPADAEGDAIPADSY